MCKTQKKKTFHFITLSQRQFKVQYIFKERHRSMKENCLWGRCKKKVKKTNNSAFSATHTYIKLTLVSFFLLFLYAPSPNWLTCESNAVFCLVRINPGKTETNKLMKTKKRRLDAEETRVCWSFVCVNWTGKSKYELDIVLVSDWGCSWICSLARPRLWVEGKIASNKVQDQPEDRQGAWGHQDEDDRWWRDITPVNILC